MADLPAVIYRTDRGRVVDEEELVYPTKMRTPPQQDYKQPQSTKIPRRLRNIFDANGKVGFPRDFPVPENSVWRLASAIFLGQTSVTVGTRSFHLVILSDEGNIAYASAEAQCAASQNARLALRRGVAPRNLIAGTTVTPRFDAGGTNGGLDEGLTDMPIPSGWKVRFEDIGAVDSTLDSSRVSLTYEEFAVPKGLSRSEIPMGLESGFQWDLSEVRQVA